MKSILFLVMLSMFSTRVFCQQQEAKDGDMKTYYLVLLKKGPNRTQDSATVVAIQEGHMAHLNKMAAAGKMNIAGPLMEDGDIRGICIYDTASWEEARQLAESDPAVRSGRLTVEIHPWYAMKGTCLQ